MRTTHQKETGSVTVALLTVILIIAGYSGTMLMMAMSGHRASSSSVLASKLLFVAEAGLNYNFVEMTGDMVYAARRYQWNVKEEHYASPTMTLNASANSASQNFQFNVEYLDGATSVPIPDPDKPPDYDQVKVTCNASTANSNRIVAAWYTFSTADVVGGAIVSDMAPTGDGDGGKSGAKEGHIVINGKGRANQHYVFGNILANGKVLWSDDAIQINAGNAEDYLAAYGGTIRQDLAGSNEEIPDFTSLGGNDQLFDFDRYGAAAAAGAGQVFTSLADFKTGMQLANSMGESLEGITVLEIDPTTESKPKIEVKDLPSGINISGTLMFKFADGTDPEYKVFILADLNVNAADLTDFDPADEDNYPSGYPATYTDPHKIPAAVDIGPTYENFLEDDDMPAIMFNNGVVDIHGAANVSGVVYGPSFIEIENKKANLQFFNGAIYGGGGVYIEGSKKAPGIQAIRFDSGTVDNLALQEGKGGALARIGFAILK
jgi:hypothetical protein